MRFLLLICLFFLICPYASAQERKENWPEGSAMHTGLMWKETHDYFLGLLEKRHEALVNLTSAIPHNEPLNAMLIGQHKAWLDYYETECGFIGRLSGAGGSWPSAYTMQCMANLVDKRFRRVASALKCMEKVPEAQRIAEQQRCLYQLAPLALQP